MIIRTATRFYAEAQGREQGERALGNEANGWANAESVA